MEQVILPFYGKIFYHEPYQVEREDGPNTLPFTVMIQIYDGIYRKKSTRRNIYYPTLRQLGGIDITERKFYKGRHFHRKITH